jgi:hypothetical protein
VAVQHRAQRRTWRPCPCGFPRCHEAVRWVASAAKAPSTAAGSVRLCCPPRLLGPPCDFTRERPPAGCVPRRACARGLLPGPAAPRACNPL